MADMAAATTWLNATLAGTAGGLTLLNYGALHNSTGPAATGANEISGGGYARQATAWTAPASASISNSGALSWSVAAATSGIGWVGEYTAVTAGTYETDIVLTSTVSFSTAGTLTAAIGALTLTAAQAA